MLLNEPPPTRFDLHFRLFGFPVRVHPLFWLIAVFLGANAPGAPGVVAWILAMFVGILVHELGHALTLRWFGFRPWITLHGLGGVTSYNPTANYAGRGSATYGQIMVSVAGPVAGFLLAGAILGGLWLAGHEVEVVFAGWAGILPGIAPLGSEPLTLFVEDLLYILIQWGLINLLPVYPLDGGQIARDALMAVSRDGLRQSLILSAMTGALLAVMSLVRLGNLWMAIFFGYLAFTSYQTYQAYSRRGPW